MFQVNDKVFYPKYGVGTISEILTINDNPKPYLTYVIILCTTYGSISLPVDEAENLGLRPLVSLKEMDTALAILSSPDMGTFDIKESWKDRKKELDHIFSQGVIADSAFLVKILYHKNQYKPLGTGERKIYDCTLKFLVDELASIKSVDPITSEHWIAKELIKSF